MEILRVNDIREPIAIYRLKGPQGCGKTRYMEELITNTKTPTMALVDINMNRWLNLSGVERVLIDDVPAKREHKLRDFIKDTMQGGELLVHRKMQKSIFVPNQIREIWYAVTE
jgi:predicted AAA+ superfamily ATPase